MSCEDLRIRLAVPAPDADGAHAIETPVDQLVDSGGCPPNRAVAIVDGTGAVLTAEQCFRLSNHFNTLGEVLKRYHGPVVDKRGGQEDR